MVTNVSPSLILRPSDYAPELIEHFRHKAEIKHVLARRRLGFQVGGERLCYLVLKGRCTIHRKSDDLLISTLTGPALIGLSNLQRLEVDAYIKTLVPCDIASLKMTDVYDIIVSNDLWEVVAKHMMVLAGKLFHSNEQLSAPSAYDIVRAQLNELINEAPSIRENITAERYIREKTHLSRSGIMRMLAALKGGGFIELHKGILVNIAKLPAKF